MTATWDNMTGDARARTAAVFEALTLLDALNDPQRARRQDPIGFADLYAYASDPDVPLSADLAQALGNDKRLAADLTRLLAKFPPYQAARQAAASSGRVEHWQGPGFTLDIRASRAEAAQVYVVVRLSDPGVRPGSLFVARQGSEFLKEPLPSAPGDTFQLLLDADADIVRALRDPGSKVFLR